MYINFLNQKHTVVYAIFKESRRHKKKNSKSQ